MGVGAGLYIYDVVKKVHVRYLISWWVLVFLVLADSGRPRWIKGRQTGTLFSYTKFHLELCIILAMWDQKPQIWPIMKYLGAMVPYKLHRSGGNLAHDSSEPVAYALSCQISRWSVHRVAPPGWKTANLTKFRIWGTTIHPFTDKSEIWQERAMVCSFLPKFHLGRCFVSPTRREKNLIVFSNSAIWGTIPKLSVAEVRTFLCTHRHQTRHFYSNGLMTNFDHKVVRLYRSKAWRIKAKFLYAIWFEPASNQIA